MAAILALCIVAGCSTTDLRQYEFNGTPLASVENVNTAREIHYLESGRASGDPSPGFMGAVEVLSVIGFFAFWIVAPLYVVHQAAK